MNQLVLILLWALSNLSFLYSENGELDLVDLNSTINEETPIFNPPKHLIEKAHVKTFKEYETLYQRSIHDSSSFWLEQADTLQWDQKPSVAYRYNWDSRAGVIEHEWFPDGRLNASANCLDRHLETKGQKPAIIWQGDNDEEVRIISFQELHGLVCRFANVLKDNGVKKGDRVCIYLPMVPELAVSLLACARIGAIHSVVFGGFSADSLSHRIDDCGCKMLITSNLSVRGGKKLSLKNIADEAIKKSGSIEKVIVVQRTNDSCEMIHGRDVWYHEAMAQASSECPAEAFEAEHPLFILYTSGSTGKPKGVVHTQGGYLLHTSLSHKYIFDIQDKDIYWCTADIGWISGHSYVIYGPLANGTTTLMFEGTPTYPSADRFWQIIEKFHVSVFYTAPTVIRTLMQFGTDGMSQYNMRSLRVLGSVGEPINPEAWLWYYKNVGGEQAPIVDTWWQTETGGIMIAPFPASHKMKPGCATRPFFGVEPIVLREDGTPCDIQEGGCLCIKKPWPGMMRTTWGDHQRFINTYFSTFNDVYFTGDGCRIDQDGDFWLLGRIDDVINISGHRIGTAEVESAIMSYPGIIEAGVVGFPHSIKGQGLYGFVVLDEASIETGDFKRSLNEHIRKQIGAIAMLDSIQFVRALPKTRSGKVVRRILRKVAEKEFDSLGDMTTLVDPTLIPELIEGRNKV